MRSLSILVLIFSSRSTVSGFSRPALHPRQQQLSRLQSSPTRISHIAAFNATYPRDPFFTVDGGNDNVVSASSIVSSSELNAVEFVSPHFLERANDLCLIDSHTEDDDCIDTQYPFASMLRNSAGYIADHSNRVAVFYIPGTQIQSDNAQGHELFSKLMGDIALAWMLGLKIVLVVGSSSSTTTDASNDNASANNDNDDTRNDRRRRLLEEEAGFSRFEVERMLSRHLRLHGSGTGEALGNVIGGNYYTARSFDSSSSSSSDNFRGYPTKIHTERIDAALEGGDIVLLSTVGWSRMGDLVVVQDGAHLAATVAASLQARKLVLLSHDSVVLRKQGAPKTMQEIPLFFGKALLDHYQVNVNKAGFVSLKSSSKDATTSTDTTITSSQTATPAAVEELLQNLAVSAWALDQGVNRAHIVNPGDGSMLEELFSSKLGLNTCLYHEDEAEDLDINEEEYSSYYSYSHTTPSF